MYTVEIIRRAQKEIEALPAPAYARVVAAIDQLAQDPRPPGCKKMTGADYWRIRVGDYRVVYNIEDRIQVVTVVQASHRRDVYR